MKHFFLLLLFFISLTGFSQIYQNPNPSLYGIRYNRGKFDSTLHYPTICGTPSGKVSLKDNIYTQSAFIFDSCHNHLYAFNPKDSSWLCVDSSNAFATTINGKQPQLNGTGFVKASGTSISYDNSSYLTLTQAAANYVPYTGATSNVHLGTTHILYTVQLKSDSINGIGVYNGNNNHIVDLGGVNNGYATFYSFAGYDANRSNLYTARSFTDKNYVDSSVSSHGGSGTVTSVGTGFGLSGGTITTSGTLTADTTKILPINDSGYRYITPTGLAASAYTLPQATSSILGGVKIGSTISVSSGTISINNSNVIAALGYMPYNASNPSNYITLSALSATRNTSTGSIFTYNSSTGAYNFDTTKLLTLNNISATTPITYNSSTGVIAISQSTTSTNGYLSNTDWNTFNGKQSTVTANAPISIVSNVIKADTITRYTGLATLGKTYNDSLVLAAKIRSDSAVLASSSGGLTGSGTVSSSVVPFATWSVSNSKISSTLTNVRYDTTNRYVTFGSTTSTGAAVQISGGATSAGLPPTSGTSFTNGILRLTDGYSNSSLNFGNNSTGSTYSWIQSADTSVWGGRHLVLNPNPSSNGSNAWVGIGIGNNTPNSNLHVKSASNTDCFITAESQGSKKSGIQFYNGGTAIAYGKCYFDNNTNNTVLDATYANGNLILQQNSTDGLTLFKTTRNVSIGSSSDATNGKLQLTGNLNLEAAGNKILIATGTNASVGTATLVGGTVTVSTTAVTASSKIFLTDVTTGSLTNIGTPTVGTITAGTSFVINSSNVLDTSNINWFIIN